MQARFESSTGRRRVRDGRRGAVVLAAALVAFAAVLAFSSSSSYGATETTSAREAANEVTKKPKVKASIRRGRLSVLGTARSDTITLRLKPGNRARLQVDVGGNGSAEFTFRRSAFDRIVVLGASGADALSISERNGVFTDTERTSLFGNTGNDRLRGGSAVERLFGGKGNDSVEGNGGADVALMGSGDDSFLWDPGDGSDVVEGQDGADTLRFVGAGAAERFDVSADGERVRFSRDVANITMDLRGTEFIDVHALGGGDDAALNDTTGTGLKSVTLDLEAGLGGGSGDGAADSVTVNGTNGPDDIQIIVDGGAAEVIGAPVTLRLEHSEAAHDTLELNGLGGADTITAEQRGLAALVQLVLNGGPDVDVLTGGDGNDRIVGQQQNDSMFGGAGDDTLVWNPGDASDLVEGQAGDDTMEFNGAGGNEAFEASAVAGRLRFTRDLGTIVMDVAGTETVDLRTLGGADSAVLNDLTGTGVTQANIDLAGVLGGAAGDASADTITVNGTDGPDTVAVAANGGVVDVTGLFTAIGISHSEGANDLLAIHGLDGDDDVVIGGGVAALIQTLVDLASDE